MPPRFKPPNRPFSAEFERFIAELGTDLPQDHSLFLRRINGGTQTPNLILVEAGRSHRDRMFLLAGHAGEAPERPQGGASAL